MSRIGKLSVAWNGLLPTLERVIGDWQPPTAKKELVHRDSLLAHLRAKLPDDSILEKEYRHLGTTVDIWVRLSDLIGQEEVAIEIKVNLTKKTEHNRLIGQIEQLMPNRNKIIVVLVGKCDEQLVARLGERYGQYCKSDLFLQTNMRILQVKQASSAA